MDPNGLTRFVSAPSSFLTNLVDCVNGNDDDGFSAAGSENLLNRYISENGGGGGLSTLGGRAYGLNQIPVGDIPTASNFNNLRSNGGDARGGMSSSSSPSPLIRQCSSPAGFINHLMVDNAAGFSITNGIGGYKYSQAAGASASNGGVHGRLNTQLSFTSTQDSLYSQMSDVEENVCNSKEQNVAVRRQSHVSGSFTMSPWDDSEEIVFSNPPRKRIMNINGDIVAINHDIAESQSLVQGDYVVCRLRAKRGFATQPRSIAERDRRGRISENLNKLQELFPEMDKQTCKAEMLDFAVKYIKSLQGEVQKLNRDIENCSCGINTQAA